MRYLCAGTLLIGLLATPASAQTGNSSTPSQVLAVLVEGNPADSGRILAVMPLEASATEEVLRATHVTLRIGTRRFVFAVARGSAVRSAVGSTVVRLRDGSRSLFDVTALLSEALAGKRDLILFTRGTPDRGVVMAVVPLHPGRGLVRAAAKGATQATIFRGGQETTVAVTPGQAGPMLVLDGSERESECRFCDGMGTMH